MTRMKYLLPLVVMLLAVSCKSEKKVTTYNELYQEKPVTILIAPVKDDAKRPMVKTTQDKVLNDELSAAAHYMRQTLSYPLSSQGYYATAPLASDLLLEQLGLDYNKLMNADITMLHSTYGIDAVLLTAIHKWQQPEINEIVVYTEYTLRSTKSGVELMHVWVRGDKMQPVDVKGEPVELSTDQAFIDRSNMGSNLAHRCILLEQMSDFALRNLPTSISRWHFQHDRYISSNPVFYSFTINPDGSIERSDYSEDAFGNECFTD